jgi:hypothetical protein
MVVRMLWGRVGVEEVPREVMCRWEMGWREEWVRLKRKRRSGC